MKIIFKKSYLERFIHDYKLFNDFISKAENKQLLINIEYIDRKMKNILSLDFEGNFGKEFIAYIMRPRVTSFYMFNTSSELPLYFKQYALFRWLDGVGGLEYATKIFKKYFNIIF